MTPRRLRRLTLLPLAALLCALAVACGGGTLEPRDACTGGLRFATPRPSPTPEHEGLAKAIERAMSLSNFYLVPFDKEIPLRDAWLAVKAEAEKAGVTIPADQLGGVPPLERQELYKESFERLDSKLGGRADEQKIIEAALVAFADAFKDGHTAFVPRALWDARQEGSIYFDGLFMDRLAGEGDLSVVTEVVPGSAAASAGLRPGDLVLNTERASDLERKLQVRNRGATQTRDVTLSPTMLPWLTHDLLRDDLGYIHLFAFPSFLTCDGLVKIRAGFDAAISDLKTRGAKAWILDLRNNGGGHVETAGFVSANFGFDGLVATMRDKFGSRYSLDIVSENAIGDAPLVILTNGRSASSSEIVAYNLQQSRRAIVVGSQSAGEVVGTRPYRLAGGAFYITSAFVDVGPGNKVLDKIGVTPDKKVALDLELLRREGRDSQLEAAIDYLKQKLGR